MTELKRMTEEHIAAVAEIERLCFSSPWSEKSLGMLTREGAKAFVITVDGQVAAYGGMLTVLDEGQVTNIATHPSFRRRGFAHAVTGALSSCGKAEGLESIYLEVRRSNLSAISLYESCGYRAIGERKNFYSDPVEDAILMKITLVEE